MGPGLVWVPTASKGTRRQRGNLLDSSLCLYKQSENSVEPHQLASKNPDDQGLHCFQSKEKLYIMGLAW